MRRTYVPLVVVASLALVALLVYGVVGGGGSTFYDDVKAGKRPAVPDRALPSLAGGEGSIADWRGKPVIVNFWASWCEPCKDEAPLMERAHARLKAKGGTVLGVTVSDATGDSEAFMREYGLSFPSLRDVDGELAEDFGTTGVPESFVVDRDGRVVAASLGQVNEKFVDDALKLVGA